MKNNVLGWILFLPGAILAQIIGVWLLYYINILTFKVMGFSSSGWFGLFYESVTRGIVYGSLFVIIGAAIAPKYQKKVALILAGLLNIVNIINYIIDFKTLTTQGNVFEFIFIIAVLVSSFRVAYFFSDIDEDYYVLDKK